MNKRPFPTLCGAAALLSIILSPLLELKPRGAALFITTTDQALGVLTNRETLLLPLHVQHVQGKCLAAFQNNRNTRTDAWLNSRLLLQEREPRPLEFSAPVNLELVAIELHVGPGAHPRPIPGRLSLTGLSASCSDVFPPHDHCR